MFKKREIMTFCFYNNIDDPIWKNNRTVVQDNIQVHIKEDILGNIFMIYTGEINYTTACFFIVRTPDKTCLKNYNHIKVLPEIHVEADAILRVAKQILEDLHVNAFYILDNSFHVMIVSQNCLLLQLVLCGTSQYFLID